ncbi:MAG: Cof-type HAD-IIB family hydrolase [Lachnospiraceae bacterium]|nr:Cof-type HAD-IIB family hydrolase [Lachnospiraceae bacterium]
MVDLHVHSTKSDGTYTPRELVDYAIEKGLSAFALTDHDCIDGLDEAIEYAESLRAAGKNAPEVIPAIEVSTDFEGTEVHIVGLYINHKSDAFRKYLLDFAESRENRNRTMCRKFTENGMPMDFDELCKLSPNSAVITRAHFARYLFEHGYVKSMKEAFDRYIGNGKPFYIPREKVTPEKAIELILAADGIPVLAHPMLYAISKDRLDALVGQLKEAGLCAIEGIYSTYTTADERFVRELADKYHLLLSGGSDFHGANKVGIDLGVGYGKLYIHDSILANIKKLRKNVLFTDMDGTLLLKDSTVSADMKAALDRAVASGHRLVLTSGRPLPSIRERIVKLGFNYPDTYIIAFGGALIYDLEAGKVIHSYKVPQVAIRGIAALCEEAGIYIQGYTDEEIILTAATEETDYYRQRVNMPYREVPNLADYLTDGSSKLQIIHLTDHEKLEALRAKIVAQYGEYVDTFFSSPRYLEILPKGVSKGVAVKFMTSYFSVPVSHTFAAGDEDNDISMLKIAGHGVAMANASEQVKAAADIITVNDNNHDGLIEILNKYFN